MDRQLTDLVALQTSLTLGKDWLQQMGQGAADNNITIQYCSALSKHLLQAQVTPAVTQVRVEYGDITRTILTGWNLHALVNFELIGIIKPAKISGRCFVSLLHSRLTILYMFMPLTVNICLYFYLTLTSSTFVLVHPIVLGVWLGPVGLWRDL